MKPPVPEILRRGAVIRDDELVPYADLVAWGTEVAELHSMSGDLRMAFSGVDGQALRDAPVEIVIAWNAELPGFD